MTESILASGKIQDHNSFDQPEKIVPTTFKGLQLHGSKINLTLPPFSVVVLALK